MSADDPPSWWETKYHGEIVPLAFVRVDRAGASAERDSLTAETVIRRRARYGGSIEDLARRTDAMQPLCFEGDGVILFYTDDEAGKTAPVCAFEAARALWERMTVDLDLRTRIAVHCAWIEWPPEIGKLSHPAINACRRLERVAPAGSVTMSERVFLALPARIRRQIGPLGVTVGDRVPAWVYPPSKAEGRDSVSFLADDDLGLWTAFRGHALEAEISRLGYVGFRLQRQEPPSLDVRDVFVPPRLVWWSFTPLERRAEGETQPEAADPEAAQVEAADPEADAWDRWRKARMPSASLTELLAHHGTVVVLGDPGAGKTTLLRWLAVMAAEGPETMRRELAVDERLLPLPVSLGRLAELRREAGDASVVEVLARYFHSRGVGEAGRLETFLTTELEAGSCLVLLDGLDEVRAEERAALRRWLQPLLRRLAHNRFLVTSRIMGYSGIAVPGSVEALVWPWGEVQVAQYLRAFHRAVRTWETGRSDAPGADEAAARMLDALRRSPRLLALARNPFLASTLALIHRAEGQLPRHRVLVYEIFTRALCETWSHARRLVAGEADPEILYEEEALPLLGHLALRMHEDHPAGTAPEDFVIEALGEALTRTRGATPQAGQQTAREFLERAAERVQVLYQRREGQWSFLHLTFQEFFVAAGLHAEERFEEVALAHLFEPRWLEVIRLGVGYYVLVQKRPRAALRFIEEVRGAELEGELAWVTGVLRKQIPLTALLMAEAGGAVPEEIRRQVAEDFSRWRYFFPLEIWEPIADQVWATDFGRILAEYVNDAHLCATSDDDTRQLGYYDAESIAEYVDPELLREFPELDSWGDDLIPALSEILLEREIPNWYAVAMLGEIGGRQAIEVLLAVIDREVDFDLETSPLGSLALAALWRVAGGL